MHDREGGLDVLIGSLGPPCPDSPLRHLGLRSCGHSITFYSPPSGERGEVWVSEADIMRAAGLTPRGLAVFGRDMPSGMEGAVTIAPFYEAREAYRRLLALLLDDPADEAMFDYWDRELQVAACDARRELGSSAIGR